MGKKKIASHWLILGGMIAGLLIGFLAMALDSVHFIKNWISPLGEIFVRLLELIAVPLLFVSLIRGIMNLQDTSKLYSISWRTIVTYTLTTIMAVFVGMAISAIFRPGDLVSEQTAQEHFGLFSSQADSMIQNASEFSDRSPLAPIVDMVPNNAVTALAGGSTMLQALVLAAFLGIAIITMKAHKIKVFNNFMEDVDAILSRCVDMAMFIAPVGIMALMANIIVDSGGDVVLLKALGYYTLATMVGFAVIAFILYPLIIVLFTKIKAKDYIKAVIPAQLMAISTSSSAATLPTTMRVANDDLKIPKSVTSFTLPLGVTINMDGTSVFQTITVMFLAQVMGIELSFSHLIIILLTAVVASIGTPGIPGGVLITLVVVLDAVGIPAEAIALVIALVRPIDLFITAVNVTGDIAVSAIVAEQVKNE